MANKPKPLDLNLVESLAFIQCTDGEMAACLGVSIDTIQRRKKGNKDFAVAMEKGREQGRMSLRRKQWDAVNKGNIVMMIWLGKQWLGQTDKREVGKPGDFGKEPVDLTDEALAEVIRQGEVLEKKHRSKAASGGNGSDGDNGDSPS